jgi:protein arginine kinase activator
VKKCDECGLFPANINLTRIQGNESKSLCLCEACAKQHGIHVTPGDAELPNSIPEVAEERVCASCGLKLSDFTGKGWLGCAACYRVFDKEIEEFFRRVHGSLVHNGKKYHKVYGGNDFRRLRHELDNAIMNEEFERAALLRDELHGLNDTGKNER